MMVIKIKKSHIFAKKNHSYTKDDSFLKEKHNIIREDYVDMQYNISKSRYCRGIQCPKILWLEEFKPEEAKGDVADSILENGRIVGELARGYLSADRYWSIYHIQTRLGTELDVHQLGFKTMIAVYRRVS